MGWGSGHPRMVEGEAELEEGEAYDDDRRIDLERDLSYLDEKVQSVLGHFQKDFEGGVSAENLGAKFGGYGSFLPTYQRSPSIWSQPKSPQRVQTHSTTRSPNYLRREGGGRNATGLPDAPLSRRNGTATSRDVDLSHELVAPPLGNGSVRQDSCLSSAQVAEKFPKRHIQSPNKSLVLNDQKPLKFRIKVISDRKTQKNAAIYSGLGLTSPSSSTGNSLGESEGNLFGSQETPDGSLSCILQMLTSVVVSGGLLLSPLHDSFLRLTSNIPKESKPEASVKFEHTRSATSAVDSASRSRDEVVLMRKQTEVVGKTKMLKESKYGNGMAFEDDIQSRLKDSSGAQMLQTKQCVSFDMNEKHVSGSIANIDESSRDSANVVETFKEHENGSPLSKREVNKAAVNGRFLGNELVKDEYFESMSGQIGAKSEHREAKSSSVQVGKKNQTKSSKDIPVDRNEGTRNKDNVIPTSFKGDSNISESERDSKGDMDHLIQNPSVRAASGERDELRMPYTSKKLSSVSKKNSKGAQVKGRVSLDSPHESRRAGVSGAVKEKGMKRDAYKGRDIYKDLFETNSESTSKAMDIFEDPSGDGLKKSSFDTVKEKRVNDRIKENPNSRKFDNQVTSGTSLKYHPSDSPPGNNGPTLVREQAIVAPVVIKEHWVGCDSCQKWRLLPYGTLPEHLPENWLCSMLTWLPGMNNCNISEDETTKALLALYQLPVPENQSGIQSHADKPATRVHPVDQHLVNQNNQNFSSDYMDNGRKKNHKTKEIIDPVGKAKNYQQDGVKRGNSKDRKQPFVGANPINKLSSQHLSEPEIVAKEHSNRQKQEHVTGGDAKPKRKGKRELDQNGPEIQKRNKTEGAFDMNNFQTSTANLGRSGFSLNTISPTMASMKDNRKDSENDFPKDVKGEERNGSLTSIRKPGEVASGLLGSESLDIAGKSNDREIPSKKRKLKDWENCQNYSDTLPSDGSHLVDSNAHVKEESSDSGFRRDKKPWVSQTDGKDSGRSKFIAELKRKDTRTRILPSTSKNAIDGNFDNPKQTKNFRVKITPQLTMEDLESLKKDLGCEPVSTAATSSSSKVSDSRKTRTSYRDMKGSPVESVSSSPMRMSNLNNLSPKIDLFGFDGVKIGDFSTNGSLRNFLSGDVNHVSKVSGMSKKRKNSDVLKVESADNPLPEFRKIDAGDKFGGECVVGVKPSSSFANGLDNSPLDIWEGHCPCPTDIHASEPCKHRIDKKQYNTVLLKQKSGKASSLYKNKAGSFGLSSEGALEIVSDLPNDPEVLNTKRSSRVERETDQGHVSACVDAKQAFFDQSGIKSVKASKHVVKRESRKLLDDRREHHMPSGENRRSGVKLGGLCNKDASAHMQQSLINDFGPRVGMNISTREDCSNGKLTVDRQPEDEHEVLPSASKLAPATQNGSLVHIRAHNDSICDDESKLSKDLGHAVHQNVPRQIMANSASDQPVVRDPSGPSLLRKDASCQTAPVVLKEAESLRCYADQLKDSGFGFECNETYFQAVLKFLHGASLLDNNSENNKPGELNQMQIYISTAKLCETCAHEYERQQEMAAAALAYKCMEVAYMRIVYCKSSSANKHWHDLQASLQNVPQGESPSSSASDIDNLNNQAVVEKASLSKSNGSQSGSHIIAPQTRPNFVRLLDFTKDVNSAMEASKKSQTAFAAANAILEEAQNKEGIVAVKQVIDFSFQDVDEFVRLVRSAVEAISR